tara:strand:+ start:899 stop:1171 length:273 start_codon:yes stop_codon:yes gene_type:complete
MYPFEFRYPTINLWVALLCLPLLMACGSLMDALEVIKDPEVQEALVQTATGAASGNLLGALYGAGALVAAIAGHKAVKKIQKSKQAPASP